MSVTHQGIRDFEAEINSILAEDCVELRLTSHVAYERLNDLRNNPVITLPELENLFRTFIKVHLTTVLGYPDGTTFTIKCNKTNIHLPCSLIRDVIIGKTWVILSVITIMRKANFLSHDPIILEIN
jgi:hypothetical protein